MDKPRMTIQEKKTVLNKLIAEVNENLSLIDEFEDMNEVKAHEIEKLRKEILAVNPDYKDDYEIELSVLKNKKSKSEL